MKVTKDLDSEKFTISTPLLSEQVRFEGPQLTRIPLLKMEDWELADNARFSHLEMDKYRRRVYYAESGVTTLEMEEWAYEVEHLGLINLLWVPHYHRTPINTICVRQLLALVHDSCLLLEGPIPITNMLIHRIIHLYYKGMNPAKEFGGKIGKKDIVEIMKRD